MRLAIRPLAPRDHDAVVDLSLRAWEPVFASLANVLRPSGLFELMHPDWRADQRAAVLSVCAGGDVWVAELDGRVIGFVAVRLHPEDEMGEIYMIAVDPDHQRGGVGSRLTSFALDRIKDAGLPLAMVETGGDPGHAPARLTYERAGFVELPISRYFKRL
ncbi:GNAT family N-acetyltransferase [Actinomadura sp. CNU-125]|uniref:GNAT family N-acetyltransferase n=1 Tax=Actinomadura sp. CNU-125 TaxID=1904961 RepID=UPI00095DF8BE|nr:GNAT family N-acetyltransferase [Actinomadura sp. CNU-125]OLT31705.1 GNAT family N-acetyltransferase [Actinomadura sp. CNU-125]